MRLPARRSIAAIAIFAILLNAFAPGVSRALASASVSEVCTAQGAALRTLGQTAPDDEHGAGPHCPYCAPHASSFGMPPPAAWSIAAPCVRSGSAPTDPATAAARATWSAKQPRAPPFLG